MYAFVHSSFFRSVSFSTLFYFLIECSPEKSPEYTDHSQYFPQMVSSAHPLANQVGMETLKAGGNAFDAAVAMHMVLAVAYPRAGNIGGGGFLVYRTSSNEIGALDFREKAPERAHPKMFLDGKGNADNTLSRYGGLSIGVPGSVAGMVAMHERFGSKSWDSLLKPSIDLAQEGFPISRKQSTLLNQFQAIFKTYNDPNCILIKKEEWKAGDTLKNEALSLTLQQIAQKKNRGFYEGPVADDLVECIARHSGILSHEDLKNYRVKWRAPIEAKFLNYDIVSMPPPSSGGIALVQLLKGAQWMGIDSLEHNSIGYIHLLTELERRVYADRAEYLGDPDFTNVPQISLMDSSYISQRNKNIRWDTKTRSSDIKEGDVQRIESFETTHFQVVDKWGNCAIITTTLNGNFGSKCMTQNTGVILNNQMDDFSSKPGHPNMYGLVGSEANKIEGNKRMLSSMSPTLVLKNNKPVAMLGTPGGSTIITSVFQTLLNTLVYNMDAQQAIDAPKYHAQWLPDIVYLEKGKTNEEQKAALRELGHSLDSTKYLGKLKLFWLKDGKWQVAADTTRGDPPALIF
jgi:gamma-glutamyltranspeptidase/glutathione hydrolase